MDFYRMSTATDHDDDMPLLTPSEGYTISVAATAFSKCDKDSQQEGDVRSASSFEQPLTLLNLDVPLLDLDDDDVSDDESFRAATPKLKMLSTHKTLCQLEKFATLM
jgi:hypothetical protein